MKSHFCNDTARCEQLVRLDRVELTQLEPTHQMLLVKICTENEQWITLKTMY